MRETFEHNGEIHVIHYKKIISVSDIIKNKYNYTFHIEYMNGKIIPFVFELTSFGLNYIEKKCEFKYKHKYTGYDEFIEDFDSVKCWRDENDYMITEVKAHEKNKNIDIKLKKNIEITNKLCNLVNDFRNYIISKLTDKEIKQIINTINLKKDENSN